MEEFLLQYKNLLTFCVEILASVVGLLLYKKYKITTAKYFIWFLIYLTVADTLGNYTKYIENGGFFSFLEGTVFDQGYCYWWYTLFWKIGAPFFFSFYYSKILKSPIFKILVKNVGYGFVLYSIIFIILNKEAYFIRFFPSISVFGAAIIFLCTVLYFIEILQSAKILSFYISLNFYISVAIFIWWLIVTPIVFYDIYHTNGDWNFIFLRWQIYLLANIFMYCTFTFALIFCKPENNSIDVIK